MPEQPLLEVEDLRGWYGESQALDGVSFAVAQGEVATLLGHNGAGKTTSLRAVMGLLPRSSGRIRFDGQDILGLPPERIARAGLAYCPEERGIFAGLTVAENLTLPPVIAEGGMAQDDILEMFPNLIERWRSPGGRLSGGEQQMLAIARILRTGARMLLLDEPTEGLAPVIVGQIGRAIEALKDKGYTVLLVEQNFRFARKLADRHHVLELGQVIDRMDRAADPDTTARIESYLRA